MVLCQITGASGRGDRLRDSGIDKRMVAAIHYFRQMTRRLMNDDTQSITETDTPSWLEVLCFAADRVRLTLDR